MSRERVIQLDTDKMPDTLCALTAARIKELSTAYNVSENEIRNTYPTVHLGSDYKLPDWNGNSPLVDLGHAMGLSLDAEIFANKTYAIVTVTGRENTELAHAFVRMHFVDPRGKEDFRCSRHMSVSDANHLRKCLTTLMTQVRLSLRSSTDADSVDNPILGSGNTGEPGTARLPEATRSYTYPRTSRTGDLGNLLDGVNFPRRVLNRLLQARRLLGIMIRNPDSKLSLWLTADSYQTGNLVPRVASLFRYPGGNVLLGETLYGHYSNEADWLDGNANAARSLIRFI